MLARSHRAASLCPQGLPQRFHLAQQVLSHLMCTAWNPGMGLSYVLRVTAAVQPPGLLWDSLCWEPKPVKLQSAKTSMQKKKQQHSSENNGGEKKKNLVRKTVTCRAPSRPTLHIFLWPPKKVTRRDFQNIQSNKHSLMESTPRTGILEGQHLSEHHVAIMARVLLGWSDSVDGGGPRKARGDAGWPPCVDEHQQPHC